MDLSHPPHIPAVSLQLTWYLSKWLNVFVQIAKCICPNPLHIPAVSLQLTLPVVLSPPPYCKQDYIPLQFSFSFQKTGFHKITFGLILLSLSVKQNLKMFLYPTISI